MSNGLLFIGVEKNNDNSKRHYFSSNKHDAAGEIIQCEATLEMLQNGIRGFPSCERKRPYQKQKDEYWNGGGIQEARRNKRQHPEE